MRRKSVAAIEASLVMLFALVCISSCVQATSGVITENPTPAAILPLIVTATTRYVSLAALHGEERFPEGARLMLVRMGHMEPLAPDLAASADASVSFDGNTVLFAAKRELSDPWQIWETSVAGGPPRRVLAGPTDLICPLWMPDGRMVYARRGSAGFALEIAALDGSRTLRLSYLPGNFIPDDVLLDGRVLFESDFPLGVGTIQEMYLVYADGSGVESVRCDHPTANGKNGRGHGRQMPSGDIVFVQSGRLARFTSALASEAPIPSPAGEQAGDVAPLPGERWLLAMRMRGEKHFALATWRPGTRTLTAVARDPGRDLVEPVVIAPRPVPNRHPTALHPWTTGNLLALDARLSRCGPLPSAPAAVRVETLDNANHAEVLGTAPVYSDGSFFLKTPADRPLRFFLLDAAGKTVRREQGWFWIRRGEQRICVGCHTGPERAPDNRVPEVLLHSTTPVDVTGGASSPQTGGR